jgi:hypothetical protein
MENIENILYDRLIKGKKVYRHYFENYKMDKIIFESDFKSILTCLKKYRSEFVVRSYKLFKSKVDNDLKIYKWNKKYESKKQKQKVFEDFCKISHDGKSSKKDEKIPKFYDVLKDKYDKQTKRQLKSELTWISQSSEIKEDEHICYYCGISQNILSILYNDPKFTCKTKRNRGSWFELDRQNAKVNSYTKENIVLCCYFCNNHKSDVISSEDMRNYFGEKMFNFLISQFNKLTKKK